MKRAARIAIGFATLMLALGFLLGGAWMDAGAALALGGLWLVGLRRDWYGMEAFGLVGFAGLAAAGMVRGFSLFPLTSVVAALAAWDLQRFARGLEDAGAVIGANALTRSHLWQLGILGGLGWMLGAVALDIRVSLGFGWALLLAALAIAGLGRAVHWLSQARD